MALERDEKGRFLPKGDQPDTNQRITALGKLLGGIDDILTGLSSGYATVSSVLKLIGGPLKAGLFMLSRLIGSVVGIFTGLVSSLLTLETSLGTLLAGLTIGTVTAFVGALVSATKAAMDYAREVNALRLNSNISLSQAGAASLRFGAFGIGPGQLSQMFGGQPSQMLGMKARLYGLGNPLTDPNFISKFAAKSQSFGSGMFGFYQRESFLKSLGMDGDQGRFLGSLSQRQIADQQGFATKAAAGLGIGPETLRQFAEELPLAMAKIQLFIQLLTVKLAQEALPIVLAVLERVIRFISEKGPEIGKAIEGFFRFLYADLPVILVDAAIAITETLRDLAKGFLGVGHTIVTFLRTLESADKGLGGFVTSFLQMVDMVSVGFTGLITGLAGLGFVIGNLLIGIAKTVTLVPTLIAQMWNSIIKTFAPVLRKLGLGGIADTAISLSDDLVGFYQSIQKMPFIDWKTAQAAIPKPLDLSGEWQNVQNSGQIGRWADSADASLRSGEANIDRWAGNALGFLMGKKNELGTREERGKGFDGVISELRKGNEINREIAGNTKQAANGINGFARATVDRVLSNIATDAFLANVGS